MREQRLTFDNDAGQRLSARLTRPAGRPRAWALFAHCFACSKDLRAARHICAALADAGIAALRFDFTGVGDSEGEFTETTFSSNVDDLVAAARYLRQTHGGDASLLVGHSLGGAAVLQAAARLEGCRAVATINAPCDPEHVTRMLSVPPEQIRRDGQARVRLGGRTFTVTQRFLEDLEATRMRESIAGLRRALLVLHAPFDDIVGIDNAARIFEAARHPKSFVSLDGADHLLRDEPDARYAGAVVAAWARRYVVDEEGDVTAPSGEAAEVHAEIGRDKYRTSIRAAGHDLVADEPVAGGGGDAGPAPYDLLLAALGACTAMTLRMYADHKGWNLDEVRVVLRHEKIHARDCETCETREGRVDQIERELAVTGALSDEQRARLLEIADRCPVHRTLHSEVQVRTGWAGEGDSRI